MTSTHKAETFQVDQIYPHENAHSLDIIKFQGYQTCVKKGDFKVGDKAVFICPDSTVDVSRPEFSFLLEQAKADGRARIKAKKLRGIVSFGLMVPVPDDTPLGEDWAERLGVRHYEPPTEEEKGQKFFMGGEVAPSPDIYSVKYDIDSFRRYHFILEPGELIHISEKADGCAAKYTYFDGQYHCSSRTEWKKEYPSYEHVTVENLLAKGLEENAAKEVVEKLHSKPKKRNLWWEILDQTPELQKFCRDHPGVVVHGEVVGSTNAIKYGFPNRFVAYDIMKEGRWLDVYEARNMTSECCDKFPWVTDVPSSGKYDFDEVCSLAEGPSLMPGAKQGVIREGIVIRPLQHRVHPHIGRVILKCVSAAFLEKYR